MQSLVFLGADRVAERVAQDGVGGFGGRAAGWGGIGWLFRVGGHGDGGGKRGFSLEGGAL